MKLLLGRCWLEPGRVPDSNGYQQIKFEGQRYRGHKKAYEILVGFVLEGLELDHLCRNRACYNPAHLEPVTGKENRARGINYYKGKTHCPSGHPYSGLNLVIDYKGFRRCRVCRDASMARWRNNAKCPAVA